MAKNNDCLRDLYRRAAQDTRVLVSDFWLNSAFLEGYQWIYRDPTDGRPKERPDDGRIRMVVNHMLANHITIMANMMQRPLAFEVRPNGADDASVEAAHVAQEVLYSLHADHDWEHLREQVLTAMKKGGTAGIALDWDESTSTTVETCLSVAEFVVEPGARRAETARWWIKAQVMEPQVVQAMYELGSPPAADATAGLNPLQQRMLSSHLGQDAVTPLTLVLTYYERPNHLTPKGRVCVEVGSQILQDGPWPFPFTDRLNLVVGQDVLDEKHWYGMTPYSGARGPQVALNMAKSNLIEHLNDASSSRLLVPHSAVRLMEALTNVPGHMLPYPDGLTPPQWLHPAQLPAWLQGQQAEYRNDIDDIMSVHDISRGRAPSNLESGSAISILAEQDGSPTSKNTRTIATMFSKLSRLVLQLLEERHEKVEHSVINTDGGPLAVTWTGKDIAGQWDAEVPYEAIVPRSRAAMQQLATKMLEMQLIPDIPTFARFAQMPNARDIVQAFAPSVAKARRENTAMANGRAVVPAVFDDHAEHITEHNDFRSTVAYERLDHEQQEAVDLHIQAHETMAAEAAAKMQARAETSPALAAVPTANNDPMPPMPEPGAGPSPAPEGADIVEPDPMAAVDELLRNL